MKKSWRLKNSLLKLSATSSAGFMFQPSKNLSCKYLFQQFRPELFLQRQSDSSVFPWSSLQFYPTSSSLHIFNFTTLVLPYSVPLHQLGKGRAPYSQQAKAWALRGNVSKNKINALASWAILLKELSPEAAKIHQSCCIHLQCVSKAFVCITSGHVFVGYRGPVSHSTKAAVHVASLHPALHVNVASWCNCQEI